MLQSLQYSTYKGMKGSFGALQFNFQPPHHYNEDTREKSFDGKNAFQEVEGRWQLKNGWKTRDGCVFMEITSAIGQNVYDWANKITLALSVTDMGKILLCLRTGNETKIMHDPGARSANAGSVKKWLSINSPKGVQEGVFFNVTKQVAGSDNVTHRVPLTGDEVMVLAQLLCAAIPKALNW